jgi:hypothetical protein
MTENQSSKTEQPVNTLSKLHRPVYTPPKIPQRKIIDVAEGVKVRSMYDGELK